MIRFRQIENEINPKQLFLVDSLGALLSAFMLGVVLVMFKEIVGMPSNVLYGLAFIACLFFVNSLFCFLRVKENWRPRMKWVAIFNLMYCCLTAGLVIYFYKELTIWGVVYFVVEKIIVVPLAIVELQVASNTMVKYS